MHTAVDLSGRKLPHSFGDLRRRGNSCTLLDSGGELEKVRKKLRGGRRKKARRAVVPLIFREGLDRALPLRVERGFCAYTRVRT